MIIPCHARRKVGDVPLRHAPVVRHVEGPPLSLVELVRGAESQGRLGAAALAERERRDGDVERAEQVLPAREHRLKDRGMEQGRNCYLRRSRRS